MRAIFLITTIILLLPLTTWAQDSLGDIGEIEWKAGRVNFIEALQDGGTLSTAMINWTPRAKILSNEKIIIGANVGSSIFKNTNDSSFFVMEYSLTGEYLLTESWSVEAQVGAQSWLTTGYDLSFMPGIGAIYRLSEKALNYIDRITLTYTPVFQDDTTHEIKLGAGLTF